MKLSGRERIIVFGGAAMVVAAAVWAFALEPIRAKLDRLDSSLTYEKGRYAEVGKLAREYTELSRKIASHEAGLRGTKGGSLLSYLETQAQRLNVKRNIVQMKPVSGQSTKNYKENLVEIKMEKIYLDVLLRYLAQVEGGPDLVRVRSLQMRTRFDNPNQVDAKLRVASYEVQTRP
jgi:type II secretory pathway component PulM